MIKSTRELIEQELKCRVTYRMNPWSATATTTEMRFLRENPRRLAFSFFNCGSAVVSIGNLPNISTSFGVFISPNGGNIHLVWNEDFDLVCDEWFMISSTTCEILCLEYILTP